MSSHPHRLEMIARLAPGPRPDLPGSRRPQAGDKTGLAALMFAAYQGTVDYTGESEAEALAEVEKTFAGGYGRFLPHHSIVVEQGQRVVCAALVTHRDEQPLLAFVMTAPAWKRHGLARAAIGLVMRDLHQAGEQVLTLALNAKNEPAKQLYVPLGFKPA